jgi:putative peptidoglycan lipid II flippase
MTLYRAFATVGGLTMVSRVLGFVRDVLVAAVLGSGMVADAFFVAFRFPNLFRRVLGEGALNAAFVPIFTRRLTADGNEAARRFAEEALAGLLVVLLVVTALAEIAMPWIMLGFAPGFADASEKMDLAVALTRIAFPYLACMSLVALVSGMLNALGRFTAAAAAPVLLNVVLIAVLAFAWSLGLVAHPRAGHLLAWGVMVAGILQLALVVWALRRAGFPLRIVRPRLSEDVRKLLRLGVPGVVSGGVTQINIFVGTIIASLQAGAVSHLYYADRLYQLPLGIVGVAIGIVLLPELSRHLASGDGEAARRSQSRGLELALMLTLPAAVALAIAAEPIIAVLFERGAFTPRDTRATAAALTAFALGLPAFVLLKVLQPAFFAREDTKTPMVFTIVNLVVNVVGSIGLFFYLKSQGMMPHVGIALATTIAAWVNVVGLWIVLARRGQAGIDARARRSLPLIVAASFALGLVLWAAVDLLAPWLAAGQAGTVRAAALASLVTTGGLVYGAALIAAGVLEPARLAAMLRRRR